MADINDSGRGHTPALLPGLNSGRSCRHTQPSIELLKRMSGQLSLRKPHTHGAVAPAVPSGLRRWGAGPGRADRGDRRARNVHRHAKALRAGCCDGGIRRTGRGPVRVRGEFQPTTADRSHGRQQFSGHWSIPVVALAGCRCRTVSHLRS